MRNKFIIGHLLVFFTSFVWATTFISTKVLLNDFTPAEILFIRIVIAIFILTLVHPKFLKLKDKKHEVLFAAAGLCGVTLYFLTENIALSYTTASNVSIIVSTAPFFTAILSHIVFKGKDKLGINFFIGFVLAITGIGLISFQGSKIEINPLGDFLSLCSAIVWACYSVITKKISTYGYGTIPSTRKIFLYGILFLIIALPFLPFSPNIEALFKGTYLANFLFLGILASAICFITWNTGLKILGPVKTSVYIYIQPVITIVLSYLILNDRFTFLSAVGTVFTLFGLVLSQMNKK